MEYTIEIDTSRGLVKASGDKEFVELVIDRYEKLLSTKAPVNSAAAPSVAAPPNPEKNKSASDNAVDSNALDEFGSVYDVTGDEVTIIADMPGNTQAAKAKNLCLLYLFAKMKLGEEIVPNEEIREVCKSHAVYDSTNFASQMKGQKKLVIASGAKGSPNFTLKLTVPGKKAAHELAKDLEAAS